MSAVAAIAIATLAGIPIAIAVDRHADPVILPALGFLYGSGLIYFVMLATPVWSASRITIAALTLAAAVGAWAIPRFRPRASQRIFSRAAAAIDLLTLYTIGGFALYATVARMWQWDFWMIWGVKGATFFESRGIDWHFLESRWNVACHPDYPLLVPLSDAYVGLLNGAWDDRSIGLLSVACGTALIVIARQLALEETGPIPAAATAFAVSAFALSAHVGMAEAPLIAFGGAGVLMLRRAITFAERPAMLHASLLLGLAACTKNEGIALIVACAVALLFVTPRAIPRLLPSVLLPLPWLILGRIHGLQSDILNGFFERARSRIDAIGDLGILLLQHFPDRWLWIAIIAGLVVIPSGLRKRERLVFLVAATQLAFFAAIYLGTPFDIRVHVETSWPRLPRQIGAPVVFVDLMMLAKLVSDRYFVARATAPGPSSRSA